MTSVVGPLLLPTGTATALIAVLAAVGSVLALVISVAFATTLFAGAPPAASVNGGWFIPPVVTIIIPMALVPLVPRPGMRARSGARRERWTTQRRRRTPLPG